MAAGHKIIVEAAVPGVNEGQRAFLRKCVRTALAAEGVDFPCEVDILVTGDEGIRDLNREQRGIDAATDVLSFPALELRPGELPDPETDADPATSRVPLGDMAISMEHVTAQAKEYGHSNRRELGYLAVHSVLHLLGYDHMDEGEEKARMRAREEAILAELGLVRDVSQNQ
ncbi:MAG: rRNA maturation RNase YbeY [Oscillibacter sp.]|nr:rRNA maturation RNase YbeY [Oscillibacter sp.]